jgi:uncharacterized protein YuzE
MVGVEIRYCTDVEALYVTIGEGKVVSRRGLREEAVP